MVSRVNEAIAIAKESGCLVSLDVADPFVIGLVSDAMWELIERHADIVFLNREEAQALCGDELEQMSRLESHARTIIIRLGSEGSLVRHDGEIRLAAHRYRRLIPLGLGILMQQGSFMDMCNSGPSLPQLSWGVKLLR